MRQTLLAWKLIENKDHSCSDYDHIHVIPAENKELLQNITSPFLRGETIAKAWRSVLKNPKKYLTLSMEEFMEPCLRDSSCQLLAAYLKKRYW